MLEKLMLLKKKIMLWPILYIAFMGISNLIVFRVFNAPYASPEYVQAMLPFIIAMAVGSCLCYFLQRDRLKEDFKTGGSYIPFLVMFLPTVIMSGIFIFQNASLDRAFIVPLVVTFAVGIAEEMMFRRILFIGLTKEMSFKQAIIISSIVFSLLHSVNVFAGLPLPQMLVQLVLTFIAGLYFAFMYRHIRSIYLMIAAHWLWDYVTLSGAVDKIPLFGGAMSVLAVLQIIAVALFIKSNIKKTA